MPYVSIVNNRNRKIKLDQNRDHAHLKKNQLKYYRCCVNLRKGLCVMKARAVSFFTDKHSKKTISLKCFYCSLSHTKIITSLFQEAQKTNTKMHLACDILTK